MGRATTGLTSYLHPRFSSRREPEQVWAELPTLLRLFRAEPHSRFNPTHAQQAPVFVLCLPTTTRSPRPRGSSHRSSRCHVLVAASVWCADKGAINGSLSQFLARRLRSTAVPMSVYRLIHFGGAVFCFDLRRRPDMFCAVPPWALPSRPLWPISDMILLTVALSCSSGESRCPAESFTVGGLFWDPLFAGRFRIPQHCMFRDEMPLQGQYGPRKTGRSGRTATPERPPAPGRMEPAGTAWIGKFRIKTMQFPNCNRSVFRLH